MLDEPLPYFVEKFGNSASRNHPFGWVAEDAVDYARDQIAKLIGASEKEIIFTSGATESNNLAIKGVFEMYAQKGNHIISVETEHKAVIDTCLHVEKLGAEITFLKVNEKGLINLDELKAAIKPNTILISIMYANNEIGVIQPIREIAEIAKQAGALYDQFVNLTNDLIKVGNQLKTVQGSYDSSMKKLTGAGNLIKKVESIKKLGAKGSKNFNDKLLERALDDDDD